MKPDDAIFVAGHRGMVGASLVRLLRARGFNNLLLSTRAELDLCDAHAVRAFYEKFRPDHVLIAAAKVGGILANSTQPVEFLSENLQIELNLINGAHAVQVKKLLFLGSSCIYPKLAPQPMKETDLLTGSLEPTNAAYALAKICGLKLCQAYCTQYGDNFISAQPTNLYGPEDNFDLQSSHVLPALIRKFHMAKEEGRKSITLWGTGAAYREFLHVDDLAEACLFLMENYNSPEFVNVGCGKEIRIRDLADMVGQVTGFTGRIEWDTTKPDGSPRKLLDVSKLNNLGWHAKIPLGEGIHGTYQWWLKQQKS
ncbi:MAG: GDP-L-fucose synthase [Methylacidiphilales bacterium]|nr:GDP-L-fucose synthase [Candidatus Methylacidiphilales bacterium]